MKQKIKIISFVLCLLTVLLLCGCSEKEDTHQAKQYDLTTTATWLQEKVAKPFNGSVGGEWLVLGLGRSSVEVPQEYFEEYYANLVSLIKEKQGILDERKFTEYSRVVLALKAIGKDPSNVEGYNLMTPLADFEGTIFQGLNGPIFALLALDCGNYEVPEIIGDGTQASREMYIDYILSNEAEQGGWSLAGGNAQVDITAMALQALAKYQDRQDVAEATNRALDYLSGLQNNKGGFNEYDTENSESVSQVIVALVELGISIDDSRFVKKGNSLEDNLLTYLKEDGSFSHTVESDGDLMATEQAFYAMVALDRLEKGLPSLYSMSNE